jgi:LEA14-like dessication related protein
MKLSKILLAGLVVLLSACVGMGLKEPINVDVVGLEPMRSDAMEARFLVKLRVQNPNDQPISFNGLYVELDVRGSRVASGVSNSGGDVPRFGESIVEIPVTVPFTALIRQAMNLSGGMPAALDYEVKGRLSGPLFGGASFSRKGELAMPGAAPSR